MSYKNSLTKIGIYSSEDISSSSQVMRLIPNLNSILILYNTRFFGFEQAPTKYQNTLITMYSLFIKYE